MKPRNQSKYVDMETQGQENGIDIKPKGDKDLLLERNVRGTAKKFVAPYKEKEMQWKKNHALYTKQTLDALENRNRYRRLHNSH